MVKKERHTKYIFITGGVVSSLGKGIVAASVGALLETRGLKISLVKADPYINIDPGTMSPTQHGEVFITKDGAETDLDIGHYERFTRAVLSKKHSFSAGKVYDEVLSKERRGDYLGGTVQVVPHITGQIKENIYRAAVGNDIAVIEIGGTVGDIEGLPFLETIRQIRYELGSENVLCIHLTLVPYLAAARELKTKPTQHSVKELRTIGIQPDVLICRSERLVPEELRHKIAVFCNVMPSRVIEACDVNNIYKLPLVLHEQGLDQIIVDHLNIWTRKPDLKEWQKIEDRLNNPQGSCSVGVVGKYVDVVDSYKSVSESLVHAGIACGVDVKIDYLDAVHLTKENVDQKLSKYDALIVPGGFGERGIDGKILSIEYARTHKKPFLGICLGMQLALIEYARNVLGIEKANSCEFASEDSELVVSLLEEQEGVSEKGGTMRLGAYPCKLLSGSKAHKAYQKSEISERHRHRYEFNNEYRKAFENKDLIFSGVSPDNELMEIIELESHPWFVACQFHPELQSKPMDAHPLFCDLLKTALELAAAKK